jgi:hypothetical protein
VASIKEELSFVLGFELAGIESGNFRGDTSLHVFSFKSAFFEKIVSSESRTSLIFAAFAFLKTFHTYIIYD